MKGISMVTENVDDSGNGNVNGKGNGNGKTDDDFGGHDCSFPCGPGVVWRAHCMF